MTTFSAAGRSRSSLRVGAVLTCSFFALGLTTASARDNGSVLEFMSQQFGFGQPSAAEPEAPQSFDPGGEQHTLTIRPHHKHAVISKPHTVVMASVKKPTGPVTIYDDPTLRPGDAVMTLNGIRIFQGGGAMPYKDADFVSISKANVPKDVGKVLLALDRVPRI